MIKTSGLKFNKNNPRAIKGEKLDKLKSSIQDFSKMMALRPIVVDETNTVLGGNMRLKAIKALGLKEIPDEWVKKVDNLTEEEKRRFIVEDNVSFGDWDFELLSENWDVEELEEWGLDLVLPDKDFNADDFFEKPDGSKNSKFRIILDFTSEEEYNEVLKGFEKYTGPKEKVLLKLLAE